MRGCCFFFSCKRSSFFHSSLIWCVNKWEKNRIPEMCAVKSWCWASQSCLIQINPEIIFFFFGAFFFHYTRVLWVIFVLVLQLIAALTTLCLFTYPHARFVTGKHLQLITFLLRMKISFIFHSATFPTFQFYCGSCMCTMRMRTFTYEWASANECKHSRMGVSRCVIIVVASHLLSLLLPCCSVCVCFFFIKGTICRWWDELLMLV